MSKPTQIVETFFESYRGAFERADVAGIADHFTFPLHVTSDAGEITLQAFATRQDWIATVQHVVALYHAIGFSVARALNLVAIEISPRLVQAVVHWALFDNAGETLYDFNATYSLATTDDALRITAISHNEVLRYRECLARLQARQSVRGASIVGPSNA